MEREMSKELFWAGMIWLSVVTALSLVASMAV